jgi:MFS family permease
VYPLDAAGIRAAAARPARLRRVAPAVWLLGLTSLFTDLSSEMVHSILPAYVVLHLGFSPLQFGVLDGLYQGVTAVLRPVGGLVADRWKRHKEVAAVGYLLSAFCKLGLLAVGGAWSALAGIIALDRAGKGLRTAPRDAMISLASSREDRGTVFGLHRALDASGAMLGPLVAFAVLALVQGGYDVVFVTSFCAATIGAGILLLLVTPPPGAADGAVLPAVSFRLLLAPFGEARFRVITLVSGALSVMTISDGFLYLRLQNRFATGVEMLPLMYVGTSLSYLLLAAPAGRLADRWGRGRVLLAGYLLLGLTYGALFVPLADPAVVLVVLILLGAYYAATDGVLVALASTVIPPAACATGLAVLTTVTSLCRLVASVLFGALWNWRGPDYAVACFGAGLACSTLAGAALLKRSGRRASL